MRKTSLGLVFLFLVNIGASAPQSPSEVSSTPAPALKKEKSKQSFPVVTTPQSVGSEIVQYLGRKTGKELMAEKAGTPKAKKDVSSGAETSSKDASLARLADLPRVPPVVKPGYVPPPPTPRVSVPQIRQQIQKILELNKQIKTVQGGSSVQLQRVQEQARIHQKILTQLEAAQKSSTQKTPVKTALLAQEKVRIIHDETQRNTQMIEELKAIPVTSVQKVAAKVKTSAS